MKGELEMAVQQLPFKNIHIIQPGILAGNRAEKRLGEKAGIVLLSVLQHLPFLKRYKPIHADIVAAAMINASFDTSAKIKVYNLDQVFYLGGKEL